MTENSIYIRQYESPLGRMAMRCDGSALTGLWFEGQKHMPSEVAGYLRAQSEKPAESQPGAAATSQPGAAAENLPAEAAAVFDAAARWLDMYFDGEEPDFVPPLRAEGTAFQKAVWDILMTIPYGKVWSYGQVARKFAEKMGRRTSARAVGSAAALNPVLLIIPCHRVAGADGSLTGYAAGVDRKEKLLYFEHGRPLEDSPWELSEYDGKIVRLKSRWEGIFEGECEHHSDEYCYHEYGREEDALMIDNWLVYASDIASLEEIGEKEIYLWMGEPAYRLTVPAKAVRDAQARAETVDIAIPVSMTDRIKEGALVRLEDETDETEVEYVRVTGITKDAADGSGEIPVKLYIASLFEE